jgi:multiple sugar transport system substrate-binding protein
MLYSILGTKPAEKKYRRPYVTSYFASCRIFSNNLPKAAGDGSKPPTGERKMSLHARASLALGKVAVALAFAGIAVSAHADTVRVTVAHYSDATAPYFEKMARNFEKANPGTTIKIEDVNWDTLQQKLQTDISGGANADLAIVGTRWLLDFVKDDVAEPLDGYMDANFKARFIGPFLAPGQINGKTYGLPIAASARALYYNKDMLAKVGYPDGPKTWNDVIDASKKLKAQGIAGFGLQGKEIETDVYYYYALWTMGGDVVGKDGKAAFNSPAGVKAATMYKQMIDQGLTQPGVTGYSREDVQNLFKQGRVAMVISAPFLAKQIKKEAPNLKYGIDPVPMGTTHATYAVTDSIVMFKNSKVKRPRGSSSTICSRRNRASSSRRPKVSCRPRRPKRRTRRSTIRTSRHSSRCCPRLTSRRP